MTSRTLRLLMLASLLGIAVALYFLVEIERTETAAGWGTKARMNPLLAAELFLDSMQLPVDSRDQLTASDVLPQSGVVYISNLGQVLTEPQRERLINWLKEGGSLILSIDHGEEDNPLLADFDIEVYDTDCGCDVEEDDETNSESTDPVQSEEAAFSEKPLSEQLRELNKRALEEGNSDIDNLLEKMAENTVDDDDTEPLIELQFTGTEGQLYVNFGEHISFDHPALHENEENSEPTSNYVPSYIAGIEQSIQFMQMEIGEGLLTVMAGNPIWNNSHIGEHDHAYLLWLLSSGEGETLLLYGVESPGLATVLWRSAPEAVISTGLLLCIGLWVRGRRFGPLRQAPTTATRSLQEHLLSSGEYHWRNRQLKQLVVPLQTNIQERAGRILLEYTELSPRKKSELLSKHTGVSSKDINAAMSSDVPETEQAFVRRIQLLQSIRDQL